jgi:hypothetical protein
MIILFEYLQLSSFKFQLNFILVFKISIFFYQNQEPLNYFVSFMRNHLINEDFNFIKIIYP